MTFRLMSSFIQKHLIPYSLPFLAVVLIVVLICFIVRRAKLSWQKNYREPFHHALLRPAGWGCIKRREDALFDIAAITVALPALWACWAMIELHGSRQSSIGTGIAFFIASVFLIRTLRKRVVDARTAYLGYLGELAVAESLEPLTNQGWKVFHDFVMPGAKKPYNIDHIVVGPTGVFAIETKARSKQPKEKSCNNEAQVDYDQVIFPCGRRLMPMKQAKGCARALRDWLNDKGVDVAFVNPVAVLPGWTLNYKTVKASREIRDPRNLASYIRDSTSSLNSAKLEKAVIEIEKHCRSIKFADVGF